MGLLSGECDEGWGGDRFVDNISVILSPSEKQRTNFSETTRDKDQLGRKKCINPFVEHKY
jgi:hypothetical protein